MRMTIPTIYRSRQETNAATGITEAVYTGFIPYMTLGKRLNPIVRARNLEQIAHTVESIPNMHIEELVNRVRRMLRVARIPGNEAFITLHGIPISFSQYFNRLNIHVRGQQPFHLELMNAIRGIDFS